jgi:DNA-binding response OmpR family regulator
MANQVLFVDDDAAIREVFSIQFSKKGFGVLAAASSEDALDLLAENSIKVVFLDLQLPGMSGVALCREIKKRNPIACVFAVTGHRSLFELTECREAGFEDYFTKPMQMPILLDAADQAFKRIERWKHL